MASSKTYPNLLKALFFLAAISLCPQSIYGKESPKPAHKSIFWSPPQDPYSLKVYPSKRRSIFWPQLASYFLPGFDQWWEKQYPYAAFYTTSAIVLELYAQSVSQARRERHGPLDTQTDLGSKDNYIRKMFFARQTISTMGSFSAYQSFRSAVRSRPKDFSFLSKEDTLEWIALSPFRFSYLSRTSTWVPLSAALLISAIQLSYQGGEKQTYKSSPYTGADFFFGNAFSYNAGVGEELLFRGWIYPVLQYKFKSEFWANMTQALLFALAHLPSNSFPLPQAVLGWHLGNITTKNGGPIGEAVFVHTWWDVIIFAAGYQYTKLTNKPIDLSLTFLDVPI